MKTLELKNKTGTKCPSCRNEESFINYLDSSTGLPIEDGIVGRCNNDECEYNLSPNADNLEYLKMLLQKTGKLTYTQCTNDEYAVYGFDCNDYWKSEPYDSNMVTFLVSKFGEADTKKAIKKYRITSPGYDKCLNVFWYIDSKKRAREAKLYKFDESIAKIVPVFDNVPIRIDHIPDYEPYYYAIDKVFFGQHLITRKKDLLVGIVQSEFTAIVASIVLPEYTWLATGGQELDYQLVKPILNKNVTLFPDSDNFQEWKNFSESFEFKVSHVLRNNSSHCTNIADYFLNLIEGRSS